jgi:hypothetical protein
MESPIYNLTGIFKHGTNTKQANVQDGMTVIDKEWIMSRFMTPNDNLTNTVKGPGTRNKESHIDAINRFSSTANLKYTDTSLGGNAAINARPQFTRYCDIPAKTARSTRIKVTTSPAVKGVNAETGYGMGRYYSEAIDDNQQHVYLEFGLPKFSGLLEFFTRAIDYEESILANTGSSPTAYAIGKTVGGLAMLAAFPLLTSLIFITKYAVKFLTSIGQEPFSYYYLNPTPHLYWGTVNTIVINLATEMGILHPKLSTDKDNAHRIGLPVEIDNKDLLGLAELLPGLISPTSNYIDVFAMATKVQQVANAEMKTEYELSQAGASSPSDYLGYVLKNNTGMEDRTSSGYGFMNKANQMISFTNLLESIRASDLFKTEIQEDVNKPTTTPPPSSASTTTTAPADSTTTAPPKPTSLPKVELKKNADGTYPIDLSKEEDWLTKYAKAQDAAVRDGGRFAIFAVDYVGSVSESFSNSIGEISSGQMLKQIGGKVRDVKFDLAGGNITSGVKTIIDTTTELIAGALDSVTFGASSVMAAMTGGGFIDLPKKWEDSDMSLPTITYNMQLISPYGNVFSQLQNMYIPLAMLLAGTLPLATGKASYTSPYLCRLYNKGVQKINLGMITSLTITRGTSNLGFSKFKRPLAIDVSFTVTDFSSIIAAPINDSLLSNFAPQLEDVTPLSNYIATLASRDINTDRYMVGKLKMKASRALMAIDQAVSPAQWGMMTGEKMSFLLGGLASDHALSLTDLNPKL